MDFDLHVTEERDSSTGAHSGIAEIRFLRDGVLVGTATAADLENGIAHFRNIRLPDNGKARVQFTAYAFNSDGVKSDTAQTSLTRLMPTRRNGRAFLLDVGVNSSAVPQLNLHFAAAVARLLGSNFAAALQKSAAYSAVSQASLISDANSPNGASKAAIREAIQKLTSEAGPDDTVFISFSSHGYANEKATFYLIPSDAGRGVTSLAATANGRLLIQTGSSASSLSELLKASVSSDELSEWLRPVDAKQIVLIIDACQSAAGIQSAGFKPGPMGSRGLGELAYTKGMVVIAAAQPDSAALESGSWGKGC